MRFVRTLRLETLEDRCLPATFGNLWPDPQHLTLSFAPDGTLISGDPSNFDALLSNVGATAARLELLRAFQTWAVNSNLNIGVVADGGQDFATGGAIQGDPRFGDIRIGAREFGKDVVAVTSPFNLFGTMSGNVVLNKIQNFSIGGGNGTYDLYTILLHEAGHVYGFDDSTNVNSVMYDSYIGPRTGLSADDITALQGMYGTRTPDSYEGTSGNDTLATATPYRAALEADISTNQDVDNYSFTVPLLTTGTTINVNSAGLSLLQAHVQVVDAAGRIYADTSAVDPLHNNLTIDLNRLAAGGKYFVRISSATHDVFGIGKYNLNITQHTIYGDIIGSLGDIVDDTLARATRLIQNQAVVENAFDYSTHASFSNSHDVDYYQITAPTPAGYSKVNLVGVVWSLNGASLHPQISVFDAFGNPVDAQILTNDGGSFIIQAAHVQAGANYFLRISSATQSVGFYSMAVAFPPQAVVLPMGAVGSLSGTHTQTAADLNVVQSQQFHFLLNASSGRQTGATVQLTIRNSQGKLIFRLQSVDGTTVSDDLVLDIGDYHVEMSVIPAAGQNPPPIGFSLSMIGITDPIGVQAADTTSSPDGGNPPPSGDGSPPPPNNGTTWTVGAEGDGTQWY